MEIGVGRHSQHVIRFSERKAQNEIVALKVEQTVVIDPIRAMREILHTQCRMAVKFIREVARVTRYQTHHHGVTLHAFRFACDGKHEEHQECYEELECTTHHSAKVLLFYIL